MYAVIESGGKQYRVEFGAQIQVDRLVAQAGDTITLDRVLLVADGDETAIGQPVVDGATVKADVVGQDRGEKIVVFKYKPKARTRVKNGFRAELTTLRISEISFGGRSAARDAEQAESSKTRAAAEAEKAASAKAASDADLAAQLGAASGASASTPADDAPATAPKKKASAKKPAARKAAPTAAAEQASTSEDKPAARKAGASKAPAGKAAADSTTAAADAAAEAAPAKDAADADTSSTESSDATKDD